MAMSLAVVVLVHTIASLVSNEFGQEASGIYASVPIIY